MRSLVALLASSCLALLLAACGGGSKASPSAPTTATPPGAAATTAATAATSPGCGKPRAAGGTNETLLTADGLTRTYRLYVPKGYDASKPVSLVLNFHGLGGNARRSEVYTGMAKKADVAGFVTVAPDGTGAPQAWHLVSTNGQTDDVAFVRSLIDTVSADLCIDPARIYATGLSDGGFFTAVLACELNGRLAAVAPVAGEPFVAPFCEGKNPIPIVAFHGTADPLVSFDGGIAGELFRVPIKGARESMASWAQFNGCSATSTPTRIAADVVQEAYTNCRNGADTQLYVIEGGGHTWPGASPQRGLGQTTGSISATDIIWSFFAAHPKKP